MQKEEKEEAGRKLREERRGGVGGGREGKEEWRMEWMGKKLLYENLKFFPFYFLVD